MVVVTDLLHEVFGYDKYSEITSEHMIRGTFCDLAVKLGGTLALLVEVKAIGLELKDQFVKQAVDYATNQGCEWVALTSGIQWRVYKVQFTKPIGNELVVEFNLLNLNPRSEGDLQLLWLLAKEGWQKAPPRRVRGTTPGTEPFFDRGCRSHLAGHGRDPEAAPSGHA